MAQLVEWLLPHQKSAVRIQSSAKIHIKLLLVNSIENRKIKKRGRDWTIFKKNICVKNWSTGCNLASAHSPHNRYKVVGSIPTGPVRTNENQMNQKLAEKSLIEKISHGN